MMAVTAELVDYYNDMTTDSNLIYKDHLKSNRDKDLT